MSSWTQAEPGRTRRAPACASLAADQQHVTRHPRADLRWFVRTAQGRRGGQIDSRSAIAAACRRSLTPASSLAAMSMRSCCASERSCCASARLCWLSARSLTASSCRSIAATVLVRPASWAAMLSMSSSLVTRARVYAEQPAWVSGRRGLIPVGHRRSRVRLGLAAVRVWTWSSLVVDEWSGSYPRSELSRISSCLCSRARWLMAAPWTSESSLPCVFASLPRWRDSRFSAVRSRRDGCDPAGSSANRSEPPCRVEVPRPLTAPGRDRRLGLPCATPRGVKSVPAPPQAPVGCGARIEGPSRQRRCDRIAWFANRAAGQRAGQALAAPETLESSALVAVSFPHPSAERLEVATVRSRRHRCVRFFNSANDALESLALPPGVLAQQRVAEVLTAGAAVTLLGAGGAAAVSPIWVTPSLPRADLTHRPAVASLSWQ